jgi:hypothetical protein
VDLQKKGVDATFKVHGKPARYTPAGKVTLDVRIIPTQPDEDIKFGASHASIETMTFLVRVEEVPRPKKGDILVFGGDTFSIMDGPERDNQRYSWMVTGQVECD